MLLTKKLTNKQRKKERKKENAQKQYPVPLSGIPIGGGVIIQNNVYYKTKHKDLYTTQNKTRNMGQSPT